MLGQIFIYFEYQVIRWPRTKLSGFINIVSPKEKTQAIRERRIDSQRLFDYWLYSVFANGMLVSHCIEHIRLAKQIDHANRTHDRRVHVMSFDCACVIRSFMKYYSKWLSCVRLFLVFSSAANSAFSCCDVTATPVILWTFHYRKHNLFTSKKSLFVHEITEDVR